MGNKNVRGKSATFCARTPSTGTSISQMEGATQPIKAGSEVGLAGDLRDKVTPEASTSAGASITTLAFRSYQTGTLHTNNFEPSGSTPKKIATTNEKKRLSGASPAFIPANKSVAGTPAESKTLEKLKDLLATFPKSNPRGAHNGKKPNTASKDSRSSPTDQSDKTGPSTPATTVSKYDAARMVRHFLTRADKSQKDVIINRHTAWHNIVRILEYRSPAGETFYQPTEEFLPANYKFDSALYYMGDKQRIAFWTCNWVEIAVNIGDIGVCTDFWGKSPKDIEDELLEQEVATVHVMNRLGEDFRMHTRTVFVTIQFPEEDPEAEPKKISSCTKEQQASPGYRAVQNIADKLKEFPSLTRVEIILRTPAYSRTPISLEQLNYALPFYELPFVNWGLKWQNTFMSRPEQIKGWPLTYLDIERAKIQRDIDRALHEQEKALEGQVFVRESASPEVHNLPFATRVETPKSEGSKAESLGPQSSKTV
jgi:hypothetical protein